MTPENYVQEVQNAMHLLQTGGRLFVIDDQSFPPPHPVMILVEDSRYQISSGVFSILIGLDRIRFTGSTTIDGYNADEFYLSPEFHL
jgi:hypothetical protein